MIDEEEEEGEEKISFKKVISVKNIISILLTNDVIILKNQELFKTIR
jgi:hypothetical protein